MPVPDHPEPGNFFKRVGRCGAKQINIAVEVKMPTEKQIQANRINALKGGVKTGQGKVKIKLNAVSHGFFSKDLLLPGEDAHLLAELRDKLAAEVLPQGEMETLLLELIISCCWRIKRLANYERKNIGISTDYSCPLPEKVLQYTNTLERRLYKAIHELEKLQNARHKVECTPDFNAIISAIAHPDQPIEE